MGMQKFFYILSELYKLKSIYILSYQYLLFVHIRKMSLASLAFNFFLITSYYFFVLTFILDIHPQWAFRLFHHRCSQATQGQYLKMRIVYQLFILIQKNMRYQAVLLLGFLAVMATGLTLANNDHVFPDRITLQASTGAYLARCHNCGPANYSDSVSVHETNPSYPYAQWTLHALGSYVALQADNGKYLSVCKNCWNNATQENGVFALADKPDDMSAVWVFTTWGGYFKSDQWALRHFSTNGFLRPCHKCVQGGAYDDFAFAMYDFNPRDNPITHWTMRAA